MPPPTATTTATVAGAARGGKKGLAYPPAADVLSKKPGDPKLDDAYELGDVLGKGAFGVVRLGIPKKASSSSAAAAARPSGGGGASGKGAAAVAVKSISKAKLVCAEDVRDVRTEVAVMSHVGDHRNVVALRSTHEDDASVHLVMDLCEGGELFDAVVAAGSFGERKAAAVFRVMVETLHHCHELGVMVEFLFFSAGRAAAAAGVFSTRAERRRAKSKRRLSLLTRPLPSRARPLYFQTHEPSPKNKQHRDLKPENFLLSGPKDGGGVAGASAGGAPAAAGGSGAAGGPPAGRRVGSVVDDPEEVARQLKLTDWGLSVFCRPGQRFRDLVGSPFYVVSVSLFGVSLLGVFFFFFPRPARPSGSPLPLVSAFDDPPFIYPTPKPPPQAHNRPPKSCARITASRPTCGRSASSSTSCCRVSFDFRFGLFLSASLCFFSR